MLSPTYIAVRNVERFINGFSVKKRKLISNLERPLRLYINNLNMKKDKKTKHHPRKHKILKYGNGSKYCVDCIRWLVLN